MTDNQAAAKRRLRRIPDELRKRSSQSCDLCRNKRCRCVPAPSGQGCVACQAQGLACSYTLPRKQRFYGSVDDLSDRYKCLEAVVRGAFPREPIATAAELMQLGQRMGYEMPDLSRRPGDAVKLEELLNSAPPSSAGSSAGTALAARKDSESAGSVASRQDEAEQPPSGEEPLGFIRDTSGREHYIGPSGSLQFLGQVRRLLTLRESAVGGDAGSPTPASRFTEDDTAQALETDGNPEDAAELPHEHTPQNHQHDGLSPGSINSSIAKDFTRQQFENAEELLRQLPPQPRIDALLQSYFRNVHEDFPLFHRGTFQEEYESHFVRVRGQTIRRDILASAQPDHGWIGCLHMMLVFGSMCDAKIEGIDHVALRRHCVGIARRLLPQLLSRCTLNNTRALLLLSLFLHNNNERNAAWNLVGTATRICFALGLHRTDTSTSFRPIERETRKRVFCTLYTFEQFLATSLGRPSGLNDSDVQVAPPREGLLGNGQDGDDDLLSLSLKLQKILSRARLAPSVPVTAGAGSALERHRASAQAVMDLLGSWKEEVSKHQGLDIPCIREPEDPLPSTGPSMRSDELKLMLSWQNRTRLRAALMLHLQYRHIAVVVTRPFLLHSVASGRAAAPAGSPAAAQPAPDRSDLAALCVEHAVQLSRIVLLLDSFDLINGISGLDVFYAYCAAMILILRSVRPPEAGAADPREAAVLATLRSLTAKLREAVLRVDKSGTMRRFARVMGQFEESVHSDRPRKPLPAGTTPGTRPGGPTFDPQMPPLGVPPHAGMGPNGEFQLMGTQLGMWPPNGLVTFEGMTELNSWMGAALLGVAPDTAMLEWGDMENILGS